MAEIVIVDRDGKEHTVQGRVGVSVMETLRELDYGVAAICGRPRKPCGTALRRSVMYCVP